METGQILFSWFPKSLQMVTAAMKLKTLIPWKKSYDQPRQHIKKQRHYFTIKGLSSDNEVAQSCPTFCNPMDCSLLRSSIHGIFQARVLEWIAISFSRGFS